MVDLAKIIDENTFVVSDTHFGHNKVLMFEPIRVEYLMDYNCDVTGTCDEFLNLLETIPNEEHRQNEQLIELSKILIPFHDEMLIEKWNEAVGENDTVLHLGDFAFRGVEDYSSKLNGRKILLLGNHDLKNQKTYLDAGWKHVIDNMILCHGEHSFELTPKVDKYWNGLFTDVSGSRILFSHYPIQNSCEWDIKKYGRITDMLEAIYIEYGGEVNIHGHTHTLLSQGSMCQNVSIEHCTSLTPMKIKDVLAR